MTTILIVEDDANFVETLKDSLATRQVEIKTAASVTDALNVLEKLTPSVIILDIQLPDIYEPTRYAPAQEQLSTQTHCFESGH